MTATVANMLSVARSQLGTVGGPPNGNHTKYGAFSGYQDQAWCGSFVDWCAAQIGLVIPNCVSTASGAAAFGKAGHFGQTAVVGAFAFYAWDGITIHHVEIVESVNADGTFVTIGGNVDSKVQRVLRSRVSVKGFGYPVYAPAVVVPPKPKPPVPVPPVTPTWPKFPGAAYFGPGKSNSYITLMGKALVKHGFGHFYRVGPGPSWGVADGQNCAAFQRAQGWSGTDANGIPGPETWARLGVGH